MANRPTTAISETSPAGNDQINAGDNRIREYKVQNREILEEDHVYPSSGSSATAGFHKKMALVETADLGTGAEGLPILGAQTVDGKAECVFTDEDDNDIPLTIKGTPVAINSCTAKTEPIDDDLLLLCDSEDSYKSKKLTLANLMNVIYPVGSVYISYVSTDPNTLFGIGTWSACGVGRVFVGIDDTQTEFDTVGETGGEKTHLLTSAESGVPAHIHPITSGGNLLADGSYGVATRDYGGVYTYNSNQNVAADASQAHNNLQPYEVVYKWRRTA